MGICSTKATQDDAGVGQRGFGGGDVPSVISLERARALSSNAASVSSRYHCGPGTRELDEDYEVFPEFVLGTGLSGHVVLAKGRHDGRRYALKRIQKRKLHQKQLRQMAAEVEIYLTLDHPNIAQLRDVYESEAQVCLITECCEGGELYSRLSRLGVYAEADAAEATRQMLHAVGYLHAHRVVHRDLKLENFLYESKAADSLLKLIDFGFAKVWDQSTPMMASCGSIAYVSPDVLRSNGYTNKCDLFSLGVIVFMLLVGYPPFHGSERDMREQILTGRPDWSHRGRWKSVSQDAVDFVRCLLKTDPLERLDVAGALAHRWLAQPPQPPSGGGGGDGEDAVATAAAGTVPLTLPVEALRSLKRYAHASHVKRAVLQLLAQELGPEETKELRQWFLNIDSSNEGTIRLGDLKQAIRGVGSPARPPRGSLMFLDTADEAVAAERVALSPRPQAGAEGSGGAEGADVTPPRTPMLSPKTPGGLLRRAPSGVIHQLFEALDANGDEQIYYSDFLAATMDARTQLREETLRAAFRRFDADSSGSITTADFRQVLGDTFEGVDVELLVGEATRGGSGQVSFEDFLRLVEGCDATPSQEARKQAGIPEPAALFAIVP